MPAAPEQRIVIAKQARELTLLSGAEVQQRYAITLGRNSAQHKSLEGDAATPIGDFYICAKNPRSKHFLSLCISYPNAQDAARGLAEGLIDAEEYRQIIDAVGARQMPPQHTALGGEIYIHGRGTQFDPAGTRGCIALENADMQKLYDLASIGMPVTITP